MFGKKILTGLMIGLLGLGCTTTSWATEIDDNILVDGQDGDIVWTVYKDGLLTLEGKGNYELRGNWDTPQWFNYRDNITSAEVNVSGITSTANMFMGLSKLTNIDLSGFDTSNVTNMYRMFDGCSSLESLDVSKLNTSNVTDMSMMFSDFSNLTELDLSNFNTSKVINMYEMFAGCRATNINLSSFDTSNVTDMHNMFAGCEATNINLNNFNTSNVENMSYMFSGCTSSAISLKGSFNTSNVLGMNHMFSECSNITELDLSNFDTSNVEDMSYMFSNSSLKELDLSNFNTSNTSNMEYMFENCENLKSVDLSYLGNTDSELQNKSVMYMFSGCGSLVDVNLSGLDTSKVIGMENMFENCTSLKNLDLSSFDTSNVESINYIFSGCSSLKSVNLSSFRTANIKYMEAVFLGCSSLESIDFSEFSCNNIEYMDDMFSGCSNLVRVDLSGFGGNGTTMGGLFSGCNSLESVDLSGFYSPRDNYYSSSIKNMFSGCTSLNRIQSPVSVGSSKDIKLPVVEGEEWYVYGTIDKYWNLPENQDYSILLVRKLEGEEPDVAIVLEDEKGNKNPSEIREGNTLTVKFEEIQVPEDNIMYRWHIVDEYMEIGDNKELTISQELIEQHDLIGKEIYCEAMTDYYSYNSQKVLVKEKSIEDETGDKGEDGISEANSGDCNIEVSQGQSFSVTIPAFISMNGEKNNDNINSAMFKTIIVADIAGGDSITIEPVSLNVTLSQVGKKDLNATITANEKGWIHSINQNGDTEESLKAGVTREHTISVANLSAGRWRGTFNWNIITTGNKIDDSVEHVDYKQYDSKTKAWTDVE